MNTGKTCRAISDDEAVRLMRPTALKYAKRLRPLDKSERADLVQEGLMGAMEAAKTFDPSLGLKFTTYAGRRVVGRMQDYLRSTDFVPRLERQMSKVDGRELVQMTSIERLRNDSGPDSDCKGWTRIDPGHFDPTPRCMTPRRHFTRFAKRLTTVGLTAEETEVLASYYVEGLTMKEIGRRMGLAESRVSQVHSSAVAEMVTATADQLVRAREEAAA